MSKPASLGRLRDISKHRSIRPPLLIPVPIDPVEDRGDAAIIRIEWPIPH